MRFRNAIVRKPGRSIVDGISTAGLGRPDYEKACKQHSDYVNALDICGLDVLILEASEEFPDSAFIEDVSLLTKNCAIITNPGAPSRKGETRYMEELLNDYYSDIYEINDPGTVEAGDIMMVGNHFYIGISARTNIEGARQIIKLLEDHGMTASTVELNKVLHLKTGVSYLENNKLVACGEFINQPEFKGFNIIEVDKDEAYAANCIWVNDNVFVPKSYPKTKKRIEDAGYRVLELDMSEFRKLDGGLSCLSLRF